MALLFQRVIHDCLPGVRFGFYSGYQSESTRLQYSVDWRLMDGRIDIAMCGYGRPVQELKDTRDALPNTPIMLGELLYPHQDFDRSEPSVATSAILLRRACDSTAGILIFNYPTLDGRSFAAIAELTRAIAAAEDCFLKGEHHPEWVDVQGTEPADFDVLSDGNGTAVLALMNLQGVPRTFRCSVRLPGGKRLVPVHGGNPAYTQSVTLAPGAIALFFIR